MNYQRYHKGVGKVAPSDVVNVRRDLSGPDVSQLGLCRMRPYAIVFMVETGEGRAPLETRAADPVGGVIRLGVHYVLREFAKQLNNASVHLMVTTKATMSPLLGNEGS